MFVNRTHGVVAATLGVLGLSLAACDDATQSTDLRSEGPPDVLAVLVMTDAAFQLLETATYCRPNDEKRPSQVGLPDFTTSQVCPADRSQPADEVTDAYPDGWYVRIMFDELLDPEIETLTEIIDPDTGEATDTYTGSIATTKPVTLRCESVNGGMVEVDYDGYYSPSGNSITWPLGPSLVIKPNDPTLIATSSACEVTINDNVTDKAGNPVDADQRGPYKFSVAPISVLAIDPSDDPDGESPVPATQIWFDNVYVQFNTAVDPSSFCDDGVGMDECEYAFSPDMGYCSTGGEVCHVGGDPCPTASDTCEPAGVYHYSLAPYGLTEAEFAFGPVGILKTDSAYTFSFLEGGKIKDRCGKEQTFGAPSADAGTLVHFTTDKFDYSAATLATGETATALKKLKLSFTNVVAGGDGTAGDPLPTTTLDPTAWTLDPMPFAADGTTVLTEEEVQVIAPDLSGQIFFSGHFQLDTTYTFTLNAGAVITDPWGASHTLESNLEISWKTQPALAITTAAQSGNGVSIGFNQAMKLASLTADDFSVVDSMDNPVTMDAATASGCGTTSTSCSLRVRKADLAPGDYVFTLKAGATIDDVFGNTYTQAEDRVVEFTVDPPAPPAPACL